MLNDISNGVFRSKFYDGLYRWLSICSPPFNAAVEDLKATGQQSVVLHTTKERSVCVYGGGGQCVCVCVCGGRRSVCVCGGGGRHT